MVETKLRLNGDAYLQLNIINDVGWAEVFVCSNGIKRNIGADAYDVLISKLKKVFKNYKSLSKEGEIDGFTIVGVFSLSEIHTTLFLGYNENEFMLFFYDADNNPGKVVEKILLDSEILKVIEFL
jgi:hypothetical protein